jgi:hypothetical protein
MASHNPHTRIIYMIELPGEGSLHFVRLSRIEYEEFLDLVPRPILDQTKIFPVRDLAVDLNKFRKSLKTYMEAGRT